MSKRMNTSNLVRTLSVGMLSVSAVFAGVASAQPAAPVSPGAGAGTSTPTQPEPARSTKDWNLRKKDRLAIEGYDPVGYFPEGGGKPVKGDEKITHEHKGALYRFASVANRDLFIKDPAKYEPAHGGWCSWAMLDGDKVEVDPQSAIVKDGRLFLFYKGWLGDTKAKWLKGDHGAQVSKADAAWKKLSGEDARTPAPASPEPAPETKPESK